ncbi:MAG: aminotransferase class I/II-fold pyridoxal phosphate-dependent enzyme [Woeseiaceae bacterium]|nr:aminotransferase class I/II-fold pyridoxal phosphate-dependent enzyme [Woeseiaceae bacterium]
MKIERFQMERMQSLYENEVKFNLSESGVWPLSLGELVQEGPAREALNGLRLGYPHAAGCESLRRNIARFYGDDDDPDRVTVTNGGSEANYMALWGLVGASDRVAFMMPNYLQGWGISRAYGGQADAYKLRMKRSRNGGWHWQLDVDSLRNAVRKNTRIIVVTNPNNPTGHVLSEEEMQAIIDEARRVGAWILSDEIYRGAEVSGPLTPTFYGRYDKVIVTSGLSKAFGLPGLRIGWIVSTPKMVSHLAQYHDYLTLTPNVLSDRLADIVMRPARRDEILKRSRDIIAGNLPLLEKWIARYDDVFDYARPMAGAIATLRYRLPIGSVALFNRLLEEQSVLITPGGHMGLGRYLRIGYGYDAGKLRQGLRRIGRVLDELRDQQAA